MGKGSADRQMQLFESAAPQRAAASAPAGDPAPVVDPAAVADPALPVDPAPPVDSRPLPFEIRPYQQRLIAQTIALFTGRKEDGCDQPTAAIDSVMIESPTGSGKTFIGLSIAQWMQRELGFSVGWAAMRRNLLSQAAAENERFGFGVDLRLISMFEKSPPAVDLLVVDEAQHDGALSMANLHSRIKPRRILGLSATPFRSDRVKLCFQKWLNDAGIHQLIQDGYLSPYHHYTIPQYGPNEVAETYARDIKRWGRSLIFFHTLAECQKCQEALRIYGVRAQVVTATTDRERQIEDFATGKINVLINMLILSEGFDCPSLQTVFCRPSGKLCTTQMCGRVFRRCEGIPFKQIVQAQDTRYPFPRLAKPAEQYLWNGGGWRSLGVNRQIDLMTQRMQALIASSRVALPKMLAPAKAGDPRRGGASDEPAFARRFRRPNHAEREY